MAARESAPYYSDEEFGEGLVDVDVDVNVEEEEKMMRDAEA